MMGELGLGLACCVWPRLDRLCPLEERGCVEGLEELKQMEEWVEEEGSKEDKRNFLFSVRRGPEEKEHFLIQSIEMPLLGLEQSPMLF